MRCLRKIRNDRMSCGYPGSSPHRPLYRLLRSSISFALASVGMKAPRDWSPSRGDDSVMWTRSGKLTPLTVPRGKASFVARIEGMSDPDIEGSVVHHHSSRLDLPGSPLVAG